MGAVKSSMSWGWIVFWLIVFWPVGLFLMVKKLANDKSAMMSGKTGTVSVIGWILVGIGSIGFFSELSSSNNGAAGLFVAIAFIVGGTLLLIKASKTKKIAVKYKKYIDMVINQNVRSIDNIASASSLSYDEVVKDLQNMIDIGYLSNAYIHQGNREIVLKQNEPAVYMGTPVINQVAPPQMVAKRCPGCGANNVVTAGRVSECEYCGNQISV